MCEEGQRGFLSDIRRATVLSSLFSMPLVIVTKSGYNSNKMHAMNKQVQEQ